MHTYKLEAGRAIIRDDVPFCNIAKSQRDGPYISPSDLDAFARLCAVAPAMLAALVKLVEHPNTPRATAAWTEARDLIAQDFDRI